VLPEEEYLAGVGRAVYCVAYTEWLVIEVVRRLDPNASIARLAGRTTGQIADHFATAVEHAPIAVALQANLRPIAADWKQLVSLRNDVVHARPATDPQGRQRLYRWAPKANSRFVTEAVLADLSAKALEISARLSPLRGQLPPAPP
jgi:thioester reductase-like protein